MVRPCFGWMVLTEAEYPFDLLPVAERQGKEPEPEQGQIARVAS